eukprot:TRINITY_DN48453_c0_g1_i1.p1 TRINITY_DN48453_c0_g1~~TRINITY_DN48453_c0_g1_i1.p1  ORF type:complete len:688 (-),score=130.94 TRINITY_DN48453_c0_g1_i1:94-2157(-)
MAPTDRQVEPGSACVEHQQSPLAEDAERPSKQVSLVIGAVDGETLQARFARFKLERQRERQLSKRCSKTTVAALRDVEGLRMRFVDACKAYIGVPYARKKHSPEDPDYNAPLFLDCCALVRRAVADLRDEFGFVLGRWNQAYQWETLPIELTEEQLRPGDLVFVEGTYFDQNKSPQRHDITHVEVFIGGETGKATVGSRWARSNPEEGKVRGVQIHPSYKFVSKLYEIKRFHFRSLETWLQGTCRSTSFPDAIAASRTQLSFGGRSVFQDGDDDGSQQGASEREDGEEKAPFTPNPFKESPTFYVGDGNNWKVIAEALETRGWRRLPFDAHFSTRFDLKWVELRSRIDYKRHIEGQLVNHVPNNDVLTSKARFVETVRAHEERVGSRFPFAPATYLSERGGEKLAALAEGDAHPESVWVLKPSRGSGGKGIELVRGAKELRQRLFPPPRDMAEEAPRSGGPTPTEGWVVQRYVERPLLLRGRKFDLRAYCLVARTTPHLWFFHPGYCKVSLEAYDAANLDNRFAHLTNACVQKQHPQYRSLLRGQHIWSEAEAEAELLATGRRVVEDGPLWPALHGQMKQAITWLFEASKDLLQRRRGFFDLLGLDFLVDEDFGLHLLEVNSNPAIWFDSSPILQKLVPQLVSGTLDIALAAQRPEGGADAALEALLPLGDFEVVVDEGAGFRFGGA